MYFFWGKKPNNISEAGKNLQSYLCENSFWNNVQQMSAVGILLPYKTRHFYIITY